MSKTPETPDNKKRIEFIDLAKGVCILLVVLAHLVPTYSTRLAFLSCFRMPLYFCLSGLFFKDYGGLRQFAVKKTNKLLIPFIAWYAISYGIYYLGRFITHSASEESYNFLDIFFKNDLYNVPIWFLLCLFWSSLLFCIIRIIAKTELRTGIGVLLLAATGWAMSLNGIFNFLYIGTALSSMPFFYLGYILKKSDLLYPGSNRKKSIAIMAVTLLGASLIAFLPAEPPRLWYVRNVVNAGNAVQIYACGAMFVVGILLLCKLAGHIPFISWIGRYSIIVLVTHMLMGGITQKAIDKTAGDALPQDVRMLLNFTLIIALMLVVIPFCRRFLPHITAQKDIFKLPENTNGNPEKEKRETHPGNKQTGK